MMNERINGLKAFEECTALISELFAEGTLTNEVLGAIEEHYSTLGDAHITSKGEIYHKNYGFTLEQFAETLKRLGSMDLFTELVGSYLWVSGNTKLHKDELKTMGFWFSGKRKSWYLPINGKKKGRASSETMDELRERFGSVALTEREIFEI